MLTGGLRSAARYVRYLPDRLLHRWRQRSLVASLSRAPAPRAVLFVCHGNICRSPFAAALARTLLPADVAVESAGFIDPGRPAPNEALAAAADRGIDLSSHRSRLITPHSLEASDLVVVMDVEQRRRVVMARPARPGTVVLLGDLDPGPITRRAVLDPVDQPLAVFHDCYDRIDRCVRVLATLWNTRGEGDSQHQ
jgi:protein-tyrosine phosphatase